MAVQEVSIKIGVDGASKAAKELRSIGEGATQGSRGVKLLDASMAGLKGVGSAVVTGLKAVAAISATQMVAGLTSSAGAVAKSVKEYAKLEQSLGGVETLFKGAASAVIANANQAYMTTGMSANDYMQRVTSFSASLIQSLKGDVNKAAQLSDMAMRDMSDNANKFGTSMESVNAAYQGFARGQFTLLDNLKLGYGGTQAEMARLINDSGVLGKEVVTATTVSKVGFDKMVEAINVIQTRMGITGTTAKESMQTIEGSANATRAALSNLFAGLGQGADVGGLVTSFGTAFEALVTNVNSALSRISISLINFANDPSSLNFLTSIIDGQGGQFLQSVGIIISTLSSVIWQMLPGVAQSFAAFAPQILTGIANSFVGNVGIILGALPTIIGGISSGLQSLIPGLVSTLQGVLPQLSQGLIDALLSLGDLFVEVLPVLGQAIGQIVPTIATSIVQALPALLQCLSSLATSLLDGLFQAFNALLPQLPGVMQSIVTALTNSIPVILNYVTTLAPLFIEGITQLISGITTVLPALIPSLLAGFEALFGGIVQALPALANALVSLINALAPQLPGILVMLVDSIVRVLDTLLPAIIDILPTLAQALITVIQALVPVLINLTPVILAAAIKLFFSLVNSTHKILPNLLSALVQLILMAGNMMVSNSGTILQSGIKLFMKIAEAIPRIIPQIPGKIKGLIDSAGDNLKRGASAMASAGYDMLKGIWQGISNAKDWIISKLGGIVNDIVGSVKSLFGIHSPSRVLQDEVGKFLLPGIVLGVEASLPQTLRDFRGIKSEIVHSLQPTKGESIGSAKAFSQGTVSHYSNSSSSNVYNISVNVKPSDLRGIKQVEEFIDNASRWGVQVA